MIAQTEAGPVEYRIVRQADGADRLLVQGREIGNVEKVQTRANGKRWTGDFIDGEFHSVADIVRRVRAFRSAPIAMTEQERFLYAHVRKVAHRLGQTALASAFDLALADDEALREAAESVASA